MNTPKIYYFAIYLLFELRGLIESLVKVAIRIEMGGLKKALPYIARQGGLLSPSHQKI
jgi:hypothetical protein